jgi:hypothetical protein
MAVRSETVVVYRLLSVKNVSCASAAVLALALAYDQELDQGETPLLLGALAELPQHIDFLLDGGYLLRAGPTPWCHRGRLSGSGGSASHSATGRFMPQSRRNMYRHRRIWL